MQGEHPHDGDDLEAALFAAVEQLAALRELSKHEISSLEARLAEAQADLARASARIADLEGSDESDAARTRARLRAALDEKTSAIERLAVARPAAKEPDGSVLEAERDQLLEERGNLRHAIREVQTEADRAREELEIAVVERDSARAAFSNARAAEQSARVDADEARADLARAASRVAALEKEREELRGLYERGQIELGDLRAERARLLEQLAAAGSRDEPDREDVLDEIAVLKDELAEAREAAQKALDQKAVQEQDLHDLLDELMKARAAERELASMRQEVFEARTRLELLADDRGAAEQARAGAETELERARETAAEREKAMLRAAAERDRLIAELTRECDERAAAMERLAEENEALRRQLASFGVEVDRERTAPPASRAKTAAPPVSEGDIRTRPTQTARRAVVPERRPQRLATTYSVTDIEPEHIEVRAGSVSSATDESAHDRNAKNRPRR